MHCLLTARWLWVQIPLRSHRTGVNPVTLHSYTRYRDSAQDDFFGNAGQIAVCSFSSLMLVRPAYIKYFFMRIQTSNELMYSLDYSNYSITVVM